jgi:hypothetical protein
MLLYGLGLAKGAQHVLNIDRIPFAGELSSW